LVTKSNSPVFGNAPGGVRPCVARYAPGFVHRENVDDFIFAKEEPNQSGHPIRITMFKPPKDGEDASTAAIERLLAHGSASMASSKA
jgi:hypothetical protein